MKILCVVGPRPNFVKIAPILRALAVLGFVAGSVLAVAGAGPQVDGIKLVDVRTHGALGDGKTDDTQAIQTAIDAVRQAGGGVVYVPEGTYVVNRLALYSNIQLMGSGWESVLKTKTGPNESDRAKYRNRSPPSSRHRHGRQGGSR